MKQKYVSFSLAMMMSVTACTMDEVKESSSNAWDSTTEFVKENATAVGAVAGAVVGYAVAGSDNRGLGVLAGALVGGLLANQLDKYLNPAERAELETYSLEQLNESQAASTNTWKSEHSDAVVDVSTSESEFKQKPVEIIKLQKVEVVPQLSLIGKTYITKQGMNVRYQPRIADNKAGSIKENTQFTAVGETDNGWILAAQNGISIGYIKNESRFIEPHEGDVVAMREEGIDLDKIDQTSVASAIDLDGIDMDSVEIDKTEVVAKTECRTVSYDISAKGEQGDASFNACRGADGAWEIS
jgi:surface antigen